MSVPTSMQPPNAPGFFARDLRDPAVLGWALLVRARERSAPLSDTYDRDAWLFDRFPPWTGDGLMSNDPALHHTNQTKSPAPGGSE